MEGDKVPNSNDDASAGWLAFVILGGLLLFVAYVIWPSDDGKTSAQRAQELEDWTRKHDQDETTRRSNKTIYDEMLRQNARQTN